MTGYISILVVCLIVALTVVVYQKLNKDTDKEVCELIGSIAALGMAADLGWFLLCFVA